MIEPENKSDQRIVGSAEPLTFDETQKRLRELEAWGVDLALVQANLELTPTERILRMIGLLELAQELRRSYVLSIKAKHIMNTRPFGHKL